MAYGHTLKFLALGWRTAACTSMAVLLIAQVRSLILRADCHRPELSTLFVLGLRAGVGNPQCNGKLFAKVFYCCGNPWN
jgi:hypothetical protein